MFLNYCCSVLSFCFVVDLKKMLVQPLYLYLYIVLPNLFALSKSPRRIFETGVRVERNTKDFFLSEAMLRSREWKELAAIRAQSCRTSFQHYRNVKCTNQLHLIFL